VKEFVDVAASAEEIAETIGLRGFEVAAIEHLDGDAVIDFEITANRPDCLSVLGLAREVATAFNAPLTPPSTDARARVRLAAVPLATASPHGQDRRRRALPAVRGSGGGPPAGRVALVDDGAAAGGRRPADQPDRRHHELRERRDRPADARVRPRDAGRRGNPGAPRE